MHCCCNGDDSSVPRPTRPSDTARAWPRRIVGYIEWAIPVAALALVPKCPMCVAAYVLVLTGIGLSFTAAAAVRWTIIALSIAALAFLLLRTARRALAREEEPIGTTSPDTRFVARL
jgi:hypothetical protein